MEHTFRVGYAIFGVIFVVIISALLAARMYYPQGMGEVDAYTYQQINDCLDKVPTLEPTIKEAFADGKITYPERDEILNEYKEALKKKEKKKMKAKVTLRGKS